MAEGLFGHLTMALGRDRLGSLETNPAGVLRNSERPKGQVDEVGPLGLAGHVNAGSSGELAKNPARYSPSARAGRTREDL